MFKFSPWSSSSGWVYKGRLGSFLGGPSCDSHKAAWLNAITLVKKRSFLKSEFKVKWATINGLMGPFFSLDRPIRTSPLSGKVAFRGRWFTLFCILPHKSAVPRCLGCIQQIYVWCKAFFRILKHFFISVADRFLLSLNLTSCMWPLTFLLSKLFQTIRDAPNVYETRSKI